TDKKISDEKIKEQVTIQPVGFIRQNKAFELFLYNSINYFDIDGQQLYSSIFLPREVDGEYMICQCMLYQYFPGLLKSEKIDDKIILDFGSYHPAVQLKAGSKKATAVDGSIEAIELTGKPFIKKDEFFFPISIINDILGYEMEITEDGISLTKLADFKFKDSNLSGKNITVDIVQKESFFEVVWEETRTDTISIERFPYESSWKKIRVTNFTGNSIKFWTADTQGIEVFPPPVFPLPVQKEDEDDYYVYDYDTSDTEIKEGESNIFYIRIRSFANLLRTYLKFPGTTNPDKTIDLTIDYPEKKRTLLPYELVWSKSENIKDMAFTEDNGFALMVSNDSSYRPVAKLICFDLKNGDQNWVYSIEKGHNFKIDVVSPKFEKIVLSDSENTRCISTVDGGEVWKSEKFNVEGIFTDTEKLVVTRASEPNPQYEEFGPSTTTECRNVNNIDEIFWIYEHDYDCCDIYNIDQNYVYCHRFGEYSCS
ncbi:MAG: hypothetical protein KAH30_01305, partial [Caldisericia bacterium]|nr:hypothetical protein [Caldisericia bacterium]